MKIGDFFYFDPLKRIKNVRPGYEAESIGTLPVLYDGDMFLLSDLATLASARNIVKASVAGCPELIMPITHACQENFKRATIFLRFFNTKIRSNDMFHLHSDIFKGGN